MSNKLSELPWNRRHAVRVQPLRTEPVGVQIMGQGFLDTFRARDISLTGVGIRVPHRFEGCNLESPVELVISIPSERPFLVSGLIVHRTKTDEEFFGVSFINLSPSNRDRVARYLAKRLQDSSEDPAVSEDA